MGQLHAHFVPFTAQRMSGVDIEGSSIRKEPWKRSCPMPVRPRYAGPSGTVQVLRPSASAESVREVQAIADEIAKAGGTPLAVAQDGRLLGVIHLKDIVKGGIRERFASCVAWVSAPS